jgi:hypothetical protein
MEEEVRENQVSRRKMLKRIGAGAAVAWTAPILTSIRTPAFAASPVGCEKDFPACLDPNSDCNNQQICQSSPNFCCCGRTPDGRTCFCYIHGSCGTPCASQADCSGGTTCVASCCGFACQSPCPPAGSKARALPRSGRLTYRR